MRVGLGFLFHPCSKIAIRFITIIFGRSMANKCKYSIVCDGAEVKNKLMGVMVYF
jgi:hypothetical protein